MSSNLNGASSKQTGRIRSAALAILALALVLGLAGLSRTAWLDEAATLRVVESGTWREWLAALIAANQPPAYPLLLTAWAQISATLPWLRVLSLVVWIGTLAITMRWAAMTSAWAMVLAGLLLATSPFM